MSEYFKSKNIKIPGKGFIEHILSATLNKLNLVTRQDFDTQKIVLDKTRLKVEQLEQQVMELLEAKQK